MGLLEAIRLRLAMSLYVGVLMFEAISIPVALWYLPRAPAVLFLAFQALLLVLPVCGTTPQWAARLNEYAIRCYEDWCKLVVVHEDGGCTFQAGHPYVIGYEPHSVLPFGLPMVFGPAAGAQKAKLKAVHTLATSVVDWCPGVRHLFYWLGGRPASRQSMHDLLSKGGSVVVIPGGVAECAYMGPGRDVVWLKNRKGFVRIALQHGASLVPVYCFGQNEVYKFVRLGPPLIPQRLVDRAVRTILFCPMFIYGVYGTPLPHRVQLHMIIGKPIPLPHIERPSDRDVQHYLDQFIRDMQQLYEKHKAAAGYPNSQLVVM